MEQSEVMDYYTPVSALEDMEAEMELSESYTSMEDFEKDLQTTQNNHPAPARDTYCRIYPLSSVPRSFLSVI